VNYRRHAGCNSRGARLRSSIAANPNGYEVIEDTGRISLADQAAKTGEQKGWSRKGYKKNSTGRVFLSDCIEQCGLNGITGSPAFGKLLTDKDSLEELTEYVPELKNVQRGDIITELVSDKNETIENSGIVTAADGTGSTDGITVVWLRSGRRHVEANTLSKFGRDVRKIRCRRLLMVKNDAEKYEHAESWDVLDKVPASAELEIGSMSEESQVSSERWRWIPNTGEYLVLRRLGVQLKNRSGMKLKPEAGSSYNIKLAGAYDRIVKVNTAAGSPGNIDNNKASTFEVAFLEATDTTPIKGTMSSTEPDGSDKKLYSFSLTAGTDPVMHISAAGRLCTPDGNEAAIGIRPESAEKAYPGDDLFLAFTAKNSSSKSDDTLVFQAKDSDYLAVYDKKLLWRANLYIEQKEPALGDLDWNDAHPWNVPPAEGAAQEGACPKSWSDAWGYNEWNRTMTPDPQFTGTATVGLSNLPAGNGGQVVTFPEFTPLRTIPAGTETNPTAGNVIGKTVAYSYPDHPEEGPSSHKGWAGSIDSPFDFVWKMKQQQTALEENAAGASTISSVLATNNQWKNYKKGTSTRHLFIPSLGLLHGFPTNGNNESPWKTDSNTTNTMDDANYWNWKYTFEAGTDCVGFAQRSASYKDGRHYEWVTLPDGIMDAGNANYNTILNSYTNNRKIPREMSYGYSIIHNKTGGTEPNTYFNTGAASIASMSDDQKKQILSRLEQIVPGDIWMKESTANPGAWDGHIAVVAYVPPNASELSVSELMNQIVLVEAEYNNKIQSVIKVLSIGDYNHNSFVNPVKIYSNPDLSFPKDGLDLHCKSWAIRRLK
jgi:hypothetical protein